PDADAAGDQRGAPRCLPGVGSGQGGHPASGAAWATAAGRAAGPGRSPGGAARLVADRRRRGGATEAVRVTDRSHANVVPSIIARGESLIGSAGRVAGFASGCRLAPAHARPALRVEWSRPGRRSGPTRRAGPGVGGVAGARHEGHVPTWGLGAHALTISARAGIFWQPGTAIELVAGTSLGSE